VAKQGRAIEIAKDGLHFKSKQNVFVSITRRNLGRIDTNKLELMTLLVDGYLDLGL
jgi:hypothetical protein